MCHVCIGMFYYTLGNIHPMFRSSLKVIQLACVAKSSDIKEYGCDSLLKAFFEQIKQLGQVMACCVKRKHFINE